jgi:hypothetical protein
MCPKIDVMERECKNYNIWKRSKRAVIFMGNTSVRGIQEQKGEATH